MSESIGYWWCPNCKEECNPHHVTYAELHESCGHPVNWIDSLHSPAGYLSPAEVEAEVKEAVDTERKRIIIWGNGTCTDHPYTGGCSRRGCSKCWKALAGQQ